MSIRLRTSRCTSASTSLPGSGRSSIVRANGRAALSEPLLPREHLLEPPARDLRERQQPQRLAGRRAVDDDHVELARLVVLLELQQREDLVHARAGPSAPRPGSGRPRGRPAASPSQRWTACQLRSISASAWTSWPQRFSATGTGCGAELGLERVGEAVRRVGRQHDGAQARCERSPARSRRRRSSCRPRPCPCRGSCGASSPGDSTPRRLGCRLPLGRSRARSPVALTTSCRRGRAQRACTS